MSIFCRCCWRCHCCCRYWLDARFLSSSFLFCISFVFGIYFCSFNSNFPCSGTDSKVVALAIVVDVVVVAVELAYHVHNWKIFSFPLHSKRTYANEHRTFSIFLHCIRIVYFQHINTHTHTNPKLRIFIAPVCCLTVWLHLLMFVFCSTCDTIFFIILYMPLNEVHWNFNHFFLIPPLSFYFIGNPFTRHGHTWTQKQKIKAKISVVERFCGEKTKLKQIDSIQCC